MDKDAQVSLDLVKLAVERCFDAMSSVSQLTDDDALKCAILTSVAANCISDAAKFAIRYYEKDGERPTWEAAVGIVLREILDALAIEWRKKPKR